MGDRIIDLSEEPVSLRIEGGRLLLRRPSAPDAIAVDIGDLAVVIASHPQVTYSNAVLAAFAERHVAFIACGGDRTPQAMLLPLRNHSVQASRFLAHAAVSEPTKKRAWQEVVRSKIRAQARLLRERHNQDFGLDHLRQRVRSGDPDNIEAQAAQRYWRHLFGDLGFRRDPDGRGPNHFLNYAYAVLRGITSRAVCATGLHPTLGIHHHHRENAFCLADDLMEPYRPLVDRAVLDLVADQGVEAPLSPTTKSALIGAVLRRYQVEGADRSLFDILTRAAQALAKSLLDRERLVLPEVVP